MTFSEDMYIDHIKYYVDDLEEQANKLLEQYGFSVDAETGPSAQTVPERSVAIGGDQIRLVLTQPLTAEHPGALYLEKHGPGVADIALRVGDAATAFQQAVRRGARAVSEPTVHDEAITASVVGFGDVSHTFVQRLGNGGKRAWTLPGLSPVTTARSGWDAGLYEVDHVAVCVEAGRLDPTIEFYENVLGFRLIFKETIIVGAQAMESKVVQSESGAITLTVLEPDVSRPAGQIDAFLENNGGSGVQHIAFAARDIVRAVDSIAAKGVDFLGTPAAYYDQLRERLELTRHSIDDLRRLNILADEDEEGQLFQIFTQSVHPRGTFFFEIIERQGARTFGSGNIKALYQAVDQAQGQQAGA